MSGGRLRIGCLILLSIVAQLQPVQCFDTTGGGSPSSADSSTGMLSSGRAFFRTIFGFGGDATKPPAKYLGDGLCLSGDLITPFVLSDQYTCPLHFYCPNLNISDPLSLPSMCPPTLDCQVLRLSSQFCPAQGRYEPMVCQRGYYCPNYTTQLLCPENHFCPYGTVDPIPCTMPFSDCPAGSYKQRYYGSAIICAIIDAILIVIYTVLRTKRFLRDRKRVRDETRRSCGRKVAVIGETTHSKREASFVTLRHQSDEQQSDVEGMPPASSSVFSCSFWRKGAETIVNGFTNYVPMSWQTRRIPTVPHTSSNDQSSSYRANDVSNPTSGERTPSSASTYVINVDSEKSASESSPVPHSSSEIPKSGHMHNQTVGTRYSLHLSDLLRGFRKAQNEQDLSLRFLFEDLSLVLPSGRTILNGVTGQIIPGRVTVIMGPSGAGKSTFMNVLMGKAARTGGRLMINDREVEMYHFKKIIGYVPQDDIMLHELSVRENIAYSAHTRLPRSWSQKEIEQFVDTILDALDLTHVADNLIDAVSGGQRKRVNIGMELVTCPSAIFLDEPTSGLDATAALKVANTMKKIAMSIGITIVAVIHQPRYEIFQEFDDLLMIAPGGVTAYLGDRGLAQAHFQNMGFYFDPRNNPADTLMDILSGKGRRVNIGKIDSLTGRQGELQPVSDALMEKIMSQAADSGRPAIVDYDIADVVAVWKKRETWMLAQALIHSTAQASILGHAGQADETVPELDEFDVPPSLPHSPSGTPTISDNALYAAMADSDTLQFDEQSMAINNKHEAIDVPEVSLQMTDNDAEEKDLFTARRRPARQSASSKPPSLSKQDLDQQHSTLRRACMERGASWVAQIVYSHNRSMVQQYRKINAYVLEIIVATVSGMVMGLGMVAYDGGLYQGLFVRPFTLISPAPIELVVPILALIIGCAVGLSGAPAGTKIFSEEREVYWREASAGHSPVAYFLGKNISTIYRLLISSLHFSAFFHLFACPNVMFWHIYNIQLFQFFCVYGIAFVVAMLVKRENASMVAVCICIVFAVLCGNGPSVRNSRKWGIEWLLDISFNRWAAEAWYSEEAMIFDGVFEIWDVSAAYFGYTLNRFWMDIFWMFIIGLVARIIAFILLIVLNRHKQR